MAETWIPWNGDGTVQEMDPSGLLFPSESSPGDTERFIHWGERWDKVTWWYKTKMRTLVFYHFVYQSSGLLGDIANQAGLPNALHLSELEKHTHFSRKTQVRPRHLAWGVKHRLDFYFGDQLPQLKPDALVQWTTVTSVHDGAVGRSLLYMSL